MANDKQSNIFILTSGDAQVSPHPYLIHVWARPKEIASENKIMVEENNIKQVI